jgi:hypothetical protein
VPTAEREEVRRSVTLQSLRNQPTAMYERHGALG